jgi:hypothetical protein
VRRIRSSADEQAASVSVRRETASPVFRWTNARLTWRLAG